MNHYAGNYARRPAFLISLLSLLLCSPALQAEIQHIELDWSSSLREIALNEASKSKLIEFKGSYASPDYKLLPSYQARFNVNSLGTFECTIQNAVYAPLDLSGFSGQDLLQTDAIIKSSMGQYRRSPVGQVCIIPLRRNASSGLIEKLVSFDLDYKVIANPAFREKGISGDYASHSLFASGNWYQFAVGSNGMYKLDHNLLANSFKIDLSAVPISRMGVFGRGGGMLPEANNAARVDDVKEIAMIAVDNNGNDRLDNDDYLYFYAQGPDQWKYDVPTGMFRHIKNIYDSKTSYYFSTDKGSLKAPTLQANVGGGTIVDQFDDYAFFEDQKNNLIRSGRAWYGEQMSNLNNTISGSFKFDNINTSQPAIIRSIAAARSIISNCNFVLNVNGANVLGHSISTVPPEYTGTYANVDDDRTTVSLGSGNIFWTQTFSSGDNGANGWIDFIEVNVKRYLQQSGSQMSFRSITSVSPSSVSRFSINNAGSNIEIWDVSDITAIKRQATDISGSNQQFSIATPSLHEFISFDKNQTSAFPAVNFVGKIENQDLHSLANEHPALVIVSPAALMGQAMTLGDWHRTHDGLNVAVVRADQVYHEFSAGAPDVSAIRDFMRMLYDKAGSDYRLLPKYLLLYGDGSFDPIDGRTQSNTYMLPTFESVNSLDPTFTFCSDDFFGCLDLGEGANILGGDVVDLAIGRIPVNSPEQAAGVNNKIFRYGSAGTFGSWRNTVTFVADDEDGNIHVNDCDDVAETIRSRYPSYNIDKIYLDAFRETHTPAGDRYPDVNTAIKNKLFQGSLVFTWVGHGGVQNWAHERIFDISDINDLENIDRLPLFVTATCEFSKYDDPGITTAGELLMIAPRGGAIGLVTTVRLVYSSQNKILNDALFQHLFERFDGRDPTMGEAMMTAKNNISGDVNNRKFTLLGDPALKLNYPTCNVVTTQINSRPIPARQDTLSALESVTIKGEVRDLFGAKMTSFNGTVYPTVYDKVENLRTLNNDNISSGPFSFRLQKNAIYKGKASVNNGDFTFSFIVPKDIDYNIGPGKLSYYAENGVIDAHGYSYNAYVGGVADSFGDDKTGPQIELFMNDEKFAYGGMTDENPLMLVKLQDANGINTVGNGIGHDITAIIDANDKNKIQLNDFYEAELNSYQKGKVKYPFRSLTEGKHNIRVKAWDVYNNSSEAYTEFIVAKSPKIALSHVLNYPNPFTTSTQFMFEHNRPGDELDITITIFTVSGKVVKTIHERILSEGYRVNDIHWDGLDDYGDKIGRGAYVYKVNVRGSDGNSAHQFEKLVVLQ